jgi:putative zinc finger protein
MSHLEDGTLHALLDGEIPSAELAPIEAHLLSCTECRARLEAERAIQGEADGLVETLEAPAAAVAASLPPPGARARPSRRWVRDVAWAATVLLAAGLGYASRGVRSAAPASQFGAVRETPLPASPPPGISAPSPAETGAAHQPAAAQSAPLGPTGTRRERPAARQDAAPELQEEKKALADKPDSVSRGKAAGVAPDEQAASNAAAAPPTPQSAGGVAGNLLRGARRFDTTSQPRLDELVVTGVNEGAVKARPAVPATITFPEAIARLGGTIRLIEGMVPARVEALGPRVRVIYPAEGGELVLEQWRSDGGVRWKLSAPAGFAADSLDRLTARVRE